jgi:protoporphyrinogen IX oxidase
MVPILKAAHIAALLIWCAGLLALPALLVQHARAGTQEEFGDLRAFVRTIYVRVLTPAAVLAVAAGTWLIFERAVFVGWMFLKLAVVGLLVGLHAFEGRLLLEFADPRPPIGWRTGAALTVAGLLVMLAILGLVLGKPVLDETSLPRWLLEPRIDHSSAAATPI